MDRSSHSARNETGKLASPTKRALGAGTSRFTRQFLSARAEYPCYTVLAWRRAFRLSLLRRFEHPSASFLRALSLREELVRRQASSSCRFVSNRSLSQVSGRNSSPEFRMPNLIWSIPCSYIFPGSGLCDFRTRKGFL